MGTWYHGGWWPCVSPGLSLAGWWLVAVSRALQGEYGDRGSMGTEGGMRVEGESRGAQEGVLGQG